jgi:hypothetical protein
MGTDCLALALCALLPAATAAQDLPQHQLFGFRGKLVGEQHGSAVLVLDDVDGDGIAEVAVGSADPTTGRPGSVSVYSGRLGKRLYLIQGPPIADSLGDRFGSALALVSDLDGDGRRDLAIGAPRDDGGGSEAGAIALHSAANGAPLLTRLGTTGQRLGETLLAEDLDGDGQRELIAGGPGRTFGGPTTGVVQVWSGAWLADAVAGNPPQGPELLLALSGPGRFGAALAALPDFDGDGYGELAVGAPADLFTLEGARGAVTIYAVGSGLAAVRLEGAQPGDGFGAALARIATVDGDGTPELAVGAPGADAGALLDAGQVSIYSGAALGVAFGGGTPSPLFSVGGAAAADRFGMALAALSDLNGDGKPEFAVGAPRGGALSGDGEARVCSGADGAVLWSAGSAVVGRLDGARLAAGDVDGDGHSDLLVGAAHDGAGTTGLARLLSGDQLRLAATLHLISVTDGATMQLQLQGPPGTAGDVYIVLGTASGTSPGLPSPVGALPINFDGYSIYTLQVPPELQNFAGLLDLSARGVATIFLPPNTSPTLVGIQLHYAFLTIDLDTPGFPTTAVSNAVPLGFEIDSCVASGAQLDCNGNGVLDACDIADGTSVDCNQNGKPDECELLVAGADQDFDGILDQCQGRVYVDADALGANNGTSWANAFTSLRQALDFAPPYTQIWVAEGTYRPWPAAGNTSASFTLRDTVGIYGGFAGGETSLDLRDPVLHPTILSGDLAQDDGLPGGQPIDNAWNVMAASSQVGPTTVVDGLIIERGNASEILGCNVFAVYFSSCRGGGFYNLGSPVIRNCVFRSNFGGHHGGAVFTLGQPVFSGCVFEDNVALRGGGAYSDIGSRPTFVNCVFRSNEAIDGAGFFATGSPADGPRFVNVVVHGNSGSGQGGALYLEGAGAHVTNSILSYNSTLGLGGGVRSEFGGSPRLENSILWGNSDQNGQGQGSQVSGGLSSLERCTVQGWTGSLGGIGNVGLDPLLVDFNGLDNLLGNADDNLRLQAGSPARDRGNTNLLPSDLWDLDRDGNLAEVLPLDLDQGPRVLNDPAVPNTGVANGMGQTVDLGPYED